MSLPARLRVRTWQADLALAIFVGTIGVVKLFQRVFSDELAEEGSRT